MVKFLAFGPKLYPSPFVLYNLIRFIRIRFGNDKPKLPICVDCISVDQVKVERLPSTALGGV
jgi:hypothetical protein